MGLTPVGLKEESARLHRLERYSMGLTPVGLKGSLMKKLYRSKESCSSRKKMALEGEVAEEGEEEGEAEGDGKE